MALFIVLLILALIIFGVGFAVHLLWWLLIVLLVIANLGLLFGRRARGWHASTPACATEKRVPNRVPNDGNPRCLRRIEKQLTTPTAP